jgi:DNA repair protein RadC
MKNKKKKAVKPSCDLNEAHISIEYKSVILNDKPIVSTFDAVELVTSVWDMELICIQEQFVAIYLNQANKMIAWRLINTGDVKLSSVDTKLIVSLALHSMASNVIIAHNHPSCNNLPSKTDIDITEKIKDALLLIDVTLVDHIIISEDGFLSMREEGMLWTPATTKL